MASSGAQAIRYIVMMQLVNKEDIAQVLKKSQELKKGLVETNSDIAFIIDFPDIENYLAHATHPDHLKVVATSKAACSALQFSL